MKKKETKPKLSALAKNLMKENKKALGHGPKKKNETVTDRLEKYL